MLSFSPIEFCLPGLSRSLILLDDFPLLGELGQIRKSKAIDSLRSVGEYDGVIFLFRY